MSTIIPKKRLSLGQIFNMSFGFFGIQFGFALQNGNASRILSTFGADVEHLTYFWLAAPLTGMIVQPLIGYFSDRTWTALGRRRPYFLAGSILACGAMVFMPNAAVLSYILPPLYVGAGILMVMDASFNVAMEPFRALVADLLPVDQRTLGFSVQTCLIGLGAVLGSWLPYILAEFFGIQKVVGLGEVGVPFSVSLSFYIGASIFIAAIVWTVITTTEFPPEEYKKEPEQIGQSKGVSQIITDFIKMPKTMKQLGLVQFFSWFALFSMWVFTTSAVATHVYGLDNKDVTSTTFNEAANWVGIIFGVYNGVSAIYALFLPVIAARIGRKLTYSLSLLMGGIGLISIYFISDPSLLIYSMIGVGMAWAGILAMPYAILAGAIPPAKMGVYMGVFNFFITFPQIVNGVFGGLIVQYLYGSNTIYAIVMAGVFLVAAAISVRFVEDREDPIISK